MFVKFELKLFEFFGCAWLTFCLCCIIVLFVQSCDLLNDFSDLDFWAYVCGFVLSCFFDLRAGDGPMAHPVVEL